MVNNKAVKKIAIKDRDYPSLLKEIKDAPEFIYVKGALPKTKYFLAVVGARKATPYGLEVTQYICKALASYDVTIVSGMALGIDGCAHRATLDASGFSIGVLGNGLNHVYPSSHRKLYNDMATQGALISEFEMDEQPKPYNFPRRNRIISGMCHAVLVVEATKKSGSLITAKLALNQGRDVFCVPGRIDSHMSTGANLLIQQGAKLITQVQDILDEFNMPHTKVPLTDDNQIVQSLTGDEKKLIHILEQAKDFQTIAALGSFETPKLSQLLLETELKGLIAHKQGQYFRRISWLHH